MGSTTSHYSELQLPEGGYHNRTVYTTLHTYSSLVYNVYIRESKFGAGSSHPRRYYGEFECDSWSRYIDHTYGTYHV
jgi:hypothetical protein